MRNPANRRTLKKAKQLRIQCGYRTDAMVRALGRKLCAWRREAVARADGLATSGQPGAGVWQLKPSRVRFIKALKLPPRVEVEALEELDELLRSSFSGVLPYCSHQLHGGRCLSVWRLQKKGSCYAANK